MGIFDRLLGPRRLALEEKASVIDGPWVDLPVENVITGAMTTAWSNGVPVLDAGSSLEDMLSGWALTGLPNATVAAIYRSQPNVRKVVSFIADNLSTVPLHLYKRSGSSRVRITDHPAARVLARPSGTSMPARFWTSAISDWLLYDRWAARIVKRDGGEMDLRRIPAQRFRFRDDELDEPVGIRVRTGDTDKGYRDMQLRALVWDYGYTPAGVGGVTPMQSLAENLAESYEAIRWRRQQWANSGRMGGFIKRPLDAPGSQDGWTPKARRRAEEEFSARYSGDGPDAGGVPILGDGMEFVPAKSFSAKDLQDVEYRQLSAAEVASFYQLAPELIGAREGTFSNVKEYRAALYQDGLAKKIARLEQALNLALLGPEDGDLYIEANLDEKLRGAFEDRAKSYVRASGRPYLKNEIREMENRKALEGGDELATPLNVLVGDQPSPVDPSGDGSDNEDAGTGDEADSAERSRYPAWKQAEFVTELQAVLAGQKERVKHVRESGGNMTEARETKETAAAARPVVWRAVESAALLAGSLYGVDVASEAIAADAVTLSYEAAVGGESAEIIGGAVDAGFAAAKARFLEGNL